MESTVAYIEIISDCQRFRLGDLFKDNKKELYKNPYLEICLKKDETTELWDNTDFVESLLISFKEGIETQDTREVRIDFEKMGIDYYKAKEILVGMYDRAMQLGMF